MSVPKDRTIGRLLDRARRSGRCSLTEPETREILSLAGISTPRERLVRSAAEAVKAAQELGFPVVMKVVSPDIPHKSDIGGVKLGLKSPEAVRSAYREILASVGKHCATASVEGILVQETVQGLEVILGTMTDPQFGPVLMFGLGGVFVEALDDVAFRVIPITNDDAREILNGIRGTALLDGYRGSPPANRKDLAGVLMKLSDLAGRFHDSIREIDINPLVVTANRSVAVDGLMTLYEGNPV